jgi:hypothetical protein
VHSVYVSVLMFIVSSHFIIIIIKKLIMLRLFHIFKSKQRICLVEFLMDVREHLRPGNKEHKIKGTDRVRSTEF